MYNFNFENSEKVVFICSLKNCKKGCFYKIIIINEDKTLGDFVTLETDELENEEENGELEFRKLRKINYNFNKNQLLNIQIIRKEFFYNKYYYNSSQRLTCMASLVTSPNVLYERKINDNEILKIQLEEDTMYNSEIIDVSGDVPKHSIFNFFKEGANLKFHFLFDFSNNNEYNNEFFKSINIFNELFVYCFNNYHLYTAENEIYMYGTGAKINKDNDSNKYFNINLEKDSKVKTCKKAKECFITCLNKIIREKNINVSVFMKDVINQSQNDNNKNYNVIFLCLRDLSNEEEIEKMFEIVNDNKEKKLPLCWIVIYIKDKNNINKIKNNIYQEYSQFIYIEIDSKYDCENKIYNCFQKIGNNISKFANFKQKNIKETIISQIIYDDKDENINENNNNNFNNINLSNNNNSTIMVSHNSHKSYKLNNSDNANIDKNFKNPYMKNKSNNTINESEHESESNEKDNINNIKKEDITNPYLRNKKHFNDKSISSNQKTDSESFNYQMVNSSLKHSNKKMP